MSLQDLVSSGTLGADETLVGTYKGRRWEATFDPVTEAVDVVGEGHFKSLTAAAMHCSGRTSNGWQFWGVSRAGRATSLRALRQTAQT